MVAAFQSFVLRLSLLGFAASLAVLVLRSRLARDTFARLLSIWLSLTALGRAVVCSFLLIGILIGGDKTNGVNNLPPQQTNRPMAQLGGGSFQTGFTGLTGLAGAGNLVSLVNPVQSTPAQVTSAERKAANWNVRGAWRDSFWLDFGAGWVFPHGTNHLSGIEVISCGEVRVMPFDTNAVASVGVPVEIVPGMSGFSYEHTPSNTYRFGWTNVAVSRDTNNLLVASIELFRNGDITITTNGVTTHLPRDLPFPHDGYGQDDEWVTANFTNAVEIAAAGGYAAWVDAQVGAGLTNGLYKFTATVPSDPPETTLITVGDLSVAITNAGEYVFLLGKGISYPLSVYPESATNIVYAAVDDVQMSRSAPLPQLRSGSSGSWSTVSGTLEIVVPIFPMVPQGESAHIVWHPTLGVSPCTWQPAPFDSTRTFTTVLADVPWFMPSPLFAWSSVGEAPVSVSAPASESATMTCAFPSAYGKNVQMLLDVEIGAIHLQSFFSGLVEDFDEGDSESAYLTDVGPCLLVDASPAVVFFEKSVGNTVSAGFACRYNVDEAGTFTLNMSNGECLVKDSLLNVVNNGYTWRVEDAGSGVKHFSAHSPGCSSSPSGTIFTVTFTPDEGSGTMTDSASVTFVEWETKTKASWPNDRYRRTLGVCETVYIKINPSVLVDLDKTSASSSLRRKGKGSWVYCAPDNPAVDEISVPGFGALFSFHVLAPTGYDAKLKTIAVGSNIGPGDSGGYAMVFDLTVLPTNVSFYAIKIMEVGMSSTNAVGYFAEPRNAHFLAHTTANVWSTVYKGNKCSDVAQMAVLPPPWGSGGSMTWPIPNEYTGNPGSAHGVFFCDTDQFFSVDADGTAREEKFGWVVEATTNRVFSYGRTTTP